jgi:hypothetical protein
MALGCSRRGLKQLEFSQVSGRPFREQGNRGTALSKRGPSGASRVVFHLESKRALKCYETQNSCTSVTVSRYISNSGRSFGIDLSRKGAEVAKALFPVRQCDNSTRLVARDSPLRLLGKIPLANSNAFSDHQLLPVFHHTLFEVLSKTQDKYLRRHCDPHP